MKLLLAFSLPFSLLIGDTINVEKASVRVSFENIKLSDTEDMGLMGVNYLLEPNDNFYYGLGAYGAVSGERGGFFVGGFSAGLKYEIYKSVYLDGGLFVGGGGGASAGQGGGLMLKAYAGALYTFENHSLGLNYSKITFPNGEINGNQIALVADMKFDAIFVDSTVNADDFKKYNFSNKKDYVVATYQNYFPKSDALTREGMPLTQTMKLIGVEYGANVSENFIAYFESAGAMGGQSTGYMEVLGGMGYTTYVTSNSKVQTKISLGAAGGGEVDTGGGSIGKASLNFDLNPVKNLNIGLGIGYFHAIEGGFDATFTKINLGVNTDFLSISDSKSNVLFDSISTQKFNIRFSNQTYLYSDSLSANAQNASDVQLLGMKIDWFMTEGAYVSGQAFGAYKGGAGGYAAGLFGVGYIQPIAYNFSAVAEVAFGAGGGGSVQSGGGNVFEPMLGAMYDMTKNMSIEIMCGKVIAINGELNANAIDFSFAYKFNKLIIK